MSEPLLSLEGVHTHIGAYHILQGVDLTVRQGELTVLLGRNGAGKTTTLRTIMGLWQPSAGTVTFEGANWAPWPHRRSPSAASPTCPRTWASSRTSPWPRT